MDLKKWSPLDTADPEVYKKTPRCYPGIWMVPWISATWSKMWNFPLHSQESPPWTSSTKSAKKGPVGN